MFHLEMKKKVAVRLASIYGQHSVKKVINDMISHIYFSKKRAEVCDAASFDPKELTAQMHMVLTGNPGVGKTELARCMAGKIRN